LGRDVSKSIVDVVREREASLLILGWPGYTQSKGQAFGTIIDLLSKNPPCDLAVARLRKRSLPTSILVPIAGGPNARLALELAVTQAEAIAEQTGERPKVVALNLIPPDGDGDVLEERRQTLLKELDIEGWPLELRIIQSDDVVQGILQEAAKFDQIIIGATAERMLEQSLFGSIPQRVAEEALTTVIMVKHYDPVKFSLRRWLTSPWQFGRPYRGGGGDG
jgi:CIC family chloride channel protein